MNRPAALRLRPGLPVIAALLVIALAGCSGLTRPAPVKQTFLIEPRTPPVAAATQQGSLRVGVVNVAAPYRGRTFVYRVSDLRFETDYYVEFLVPPAALLAEQTARALGGARVFARVLGPGTSGDADWALDGFASSLYADQRDAAKPAAVLAITYYLLPAAGDAQTPVWSREYRKEVAMRELSPAAYAEALNTAFGEIVADLARDLGSLTLPKP